METASSEPSLDAAVRASVTIGRSADELRALWLRSDTQSRIWADFADVTADDDGSAEWTARGPAGGEYRWRTAVQDADPTTVR